MAMAMMSLLLMGAHPVNQFTGLDVDRANGGFSFIEKGAFPISWAVLESVLLFSIRLYFKRRYGIMFPFAEASSD